MRLRWSSALVLLLAPLSAEAQYQRVATQAESVELDAVASASVRIVNGSNSFSGTIVSPLVDSGGRQRWYVLTCAHGFRGRIGGEVTIITGGRRLTGWLRHHDRAADVSVVELPEGEYASAPLYEGVPPAGARALTVGYPSGVLQIIETNVCSTTAWMLGEGYRLTLDTAVSMGHSGGGAFIGGRLAGIAQATDGQHSMFCLPAAIHDAYHTVAGAIGAAANC